MPLPTRRQPVIVNLRQQRDKKKFKQRPNSTRSTPRCNMSIYEAVNITGTSRAIVSDIQKSLTFNNQMRIENFLYSAACRGERLGVLSVEISSDTLLAVHTDYAFSEKSWVVEYAFTQLLGHMQGLLLSYLVI